MSRYTARHLIGGSVFWEVVQLLASIAVATVLFALAFRFLPDAIVKWRDVFGGAAVTAVLFVLGKFTLALYLSKASVGSGFGAAGSIIVVLVWVYWSTHIFLFGVSSRTRTRRSIAATSPLWNRSSILGPGARLGH